MIPSNLDYSSLKWQVLKFAIVFSLGVLLGSSDKTRGFALIMMITAVIAAVIMLVR